MKNNYPLESIKVGDMYRHFKGNIYEILGVAVHTETLENLVIYASLKDSKVIWARPLSNFLDKVVDPNDLDNMIPRFMKIEALNDE